MQTFRRIAPCLVSVVALSALAGVSLVARRAAADDDAASTGTGAASSEPKTAPAETVVTAFTYKTGVAAGTVGASTFGNGVAASGAGVWSVGGSVWGSPIDRLTIVADATRSLDAQFSPSAGLIYRLLGRHDRGFSFGVLAKYKIDGFARGPNKELESEIESGAVLSYVESRLHFDLNGIVGVGPGDDREVDSEGRVRFGYDVHRNVRLGIDEQARWRLAGVNRLPGNRSWDFAGGAQILVSWRNLFGAVTAGPTTMGVVDPGRVGWMGMLTLGAVSL